MELSGVRRAARRLPHRRRARCRCRARRVAKSNDIGAKIVEWANQILSLGRSPLVPHMHRSISPGERAVRFDDPPLSRGCGKESWLYVAGVAAALLAMLAALVVWARYFGGDDPPGWSVAVTICVQRTPLGPVPGTGFVPKPDLMLRVVFATSHSIERPLAPST